MIFDLVSENNFLSYSYEHSVNSLLTIYNYADLSLHINFQWVLFLPQVSLMEYLPQHINKTPPNESRSTM